MREDFEASISSLEGTGEKKETLDAKDQEEGEGAEVQEEGPEGAGEEKGGGEEHQGGRDDGGGAKAAADTEDSIGDGEREHEKTDLASRAPAGWTPAERELWADLPPAVQARVAKREQQINLALQDGAVNRKAGEGFKSVTDRYARVIAMEGVTDPLDGFEKLMQSVAVMRLGTPEQKARKIADFIKGYGVPIEMLDEVLSQDQGGQAGVPNPVAQMMDRRMAPMEKLLQRIEHADRERSQQSQNKATGDVNDFAQGHEFFADVQADMADLLEMAANRGQLMTMEQAYDKALTLSPEISDVRRQRAEQSGHAAAKETLAAKRKASGSIHGSKGGAADTGGGDTLRSQLEHAWGGDQ